MKALVVLGLGLVLVAVITAFAFLWRTPRATPGRASVLFVGTTNVSAGARLGDGTPEFPFFDLAARGITNIPDSVHVGLFVITNGTFKNVQFYLEAIEVRQEGQWISRAPDWGGFGRELEPRKSWVQPVPEPAGNLPWRFRLVIQERPRPHSLRGSLDRATIKTANVVLLPSRWSYKISRIFSPTIQRGRAEPDGAANRGQPVGSEIHRTSAAAGPGG